MYYIYTLTLRRSRKKIRLLLFTQKQIIMSQTILNNQEKTIKEEKKAIFSVNHLIKEGETAKQLQKRLAAEKRAATNEAGKNMAKAISAQKYNLNAILYMFEHLTRIESDKFCENLSKETGKNITVPIVVKLSKFKYLDYIKEIEAARGMIRGGITPAEFKNALTRYYRGEKVASYLDAEKAILATVYTHGAE
jgi:hypothetical protein